MVVGFVGRNDCTDEGRTKLVHEWICGKEWDGSGENEKKNKGRINR